VVKALRGDENRQKPSFSCVKMEKALNYVVPLRTGGENAYNFCFIKKKHGTGPLPDRCTGHEMFPHTRKSIARHNLRGVKTKQGKII